IRSCRPARVADSRSPRTRRRARHSRRPERGGCGPGPSRKKRRARVEGGGHRPRAPPGGRRVPGRAPRGGPRAPVPRHAHGGGGREGRIRRRLTGTLQETAEPPVDPIGTRDSSAPRRILLMMALGSDPRAVALRVHLLFVFAGAVALGVGSVVLLIAAGVWLGGGGAGALVIRLPALVIHFVAWMLLLASLKALSLSPNKDEERLMVQMMIAWVLSVVAAFVGIWSLPWVLGGGICSGIVCSLSIVFFLPAPYLPFVPSVFAPVVACHAAFFLLESRRHEPVASGRLRNGAIVLLVIAAVSIAVQAAHWFYGPAYLLAGLTAIGYLWIAAGLYRPLPTSRDFTESLPEASRPEGL